MEGDLFSLKSSRELTVTDTLLTLGAEVRSLRKALATKENLAALRLELETLVPAFVEQRAAPLETKLLKLTQGHEALKKEGAELEGGGSTTGGDKQDPARKQEAVLGWPEGLEAHTRLEELEAQVEEKLGDHRPLTYHLVQKNLGFVWAATRTVDGNIGPHMKTRGPYNVAAWHQQGREGGAGPTPCDFKHCKTSDGEERLQCTFALEGGCDLSAVSL